MPELPEVETVRIGLQRLLPGKVIQAVDFDWPKGFPNAPHDVKAFLIGAKIVKVNRRAKVLMIELSTEFSLIIHLKMTGQLVYRSSQENFGAGHPNASLIGDLPDKSTRVTITFQDGGHVYFNDQRKFGWMRLLPTTEVPLTSFFQKVGPEPLTDDFTWQIMRDRLLRRKNTNIKAALLDQSVIAGVGNIYADESLWGAKVHPTRVVHSLSNKDFKNLHKALVDVLKLSISKGGSTAQHYVDAQGKPGKYLDFANVFRREGLHCTRCGTIIVKSRVAGRGTHTCPTCQRP